MKLSKKAEFITIRRQADMVTNLADIVTNLTDIVTDKQTF